MSRFKPSIAVIQFPGTNCEYETAAAVRAAGMHADIFRWNRDPSGLEAFDGYVLPGGFSYQDRVRAGVIASKTRIIDYLFSAGDAGKPILGICNGAQILVETGLIPGLKPGSIQMALDSNYPSNGFRGYLCEWVYIKVEPVFAGACFHEVFRAGTVFPIPIAHAEGRFTTRDESVRNALTRKKLIGFTYCRKDGRAVPVFPANPNGSILNIAGLYNPAGNVLAFMPHPERAAWMRQVPRELRSGNSRMTAHLHEGVSDTASGPGLGFFQAMNLYIRRKRGEE